MFLHTKERQEQLKLKVYEKTTYITRLNARTKAMLQPAEDTDDELSKETVNNKESMVLKDDFVLSTTKGSGMTLKTINAYIMLYNRYVI